MTKKLAALLLLPIMLLSCSHINNLAKIPPQRSTKREDRREERNHACVYKPILNLSQRLKKYPFDSAAQIKLVSWINEQDTTHIPEFISREGLPMLNDTVCYSKLKELKVLNLTQVDSLTSVLYNYSYGGRVYTGSISDCYTPRNAILFLNTEGKTFEYLEICFECGRIKSSSEGMEKGDMCNEKMGMIKDFFERAGISYGVTTYFGQSN